MEIIEVKKAERLAAKNTPEVLAAEAKDEEKALNIASAEAARAHAEHLAEQARIRELLRAQQATAAAAGENNDDELASVSPNTTTAKPVIIPSAIDESLFDFSTIDLTKAEQSKYDAAIAAIGSGEEPTDFRGAMQKSPLGIAGFNILHCGISNGKRIYYVLHEGKVYIIDVSNHDMRRLENAVERFKKK
jgi:hypothetical protein